MKKGTLLKVRIEKVGFGGTGIGRLDVNLNPDVEILKDETGKKVLVQNTLPGEIALATVSRNKKKYIEAVKEETVEISPLEIKPRCKHFDICGGCKWQNLEYEQQLKIKETHVKETFAHLGGFDEGMIEKIMRPIQGCKEIWNYRNKVEFSFGWDKDMRWSFGLHADRRRYDIFNIEECHIISEKMFEIGVAVRDFAKLHKLEPFKYRKNSGLLRSLTIREGRNTGEILVNLELGAEEFPKKLREGLIETLRPFDINSLYITNIVTLRGEKTKSVATLLHGKPNIFEKMTVGGEECRFEISPSSFFQTNTIQAEGLYEATLQLLDFQVNDIILDLFCGTGTIGMFIAPHVKKVIGIELNKEAVENAKVNATLNKIDNIEFIEGDVGCVLEQFEKEGRAEELKGQKIILDPPRSGLTPKMLEQVLAFSPREIIYISCNPTTQARDIKVLVGGATEFQGNILQHQPHYALSTLAPIDMFPHTYHIECVARLTTDRVD